MHDVGSHADRGSNLHAEGHQEHVCDDVICTHDTISRSALCLSQKHAVCAAAQEVYQGMLRVIRAHQGMRM